MRAANYETLRNLTHFKITKCKDLLPAFALFLTAAVPLPRGGHIANIPDLCLFYRVTGFPCPGCGMTRSMVCCGHGCWSLAFHYHPVGPLIFAGLVCWSIIGIARFAKNITNREKLSIDLGSVRSKQKRAASFLIGKVYNLAIIFLTVSLMIVWAGRLIRVIPWP